jgi:hypothetical protein
MCCSDRNSLIAIYNLKRSQGTSQRRRKRFYAVESTHRYMSGYRQEKTSLFGYLFVNDVLLITFLFTKRRQG